MTYHKLATWPLTRRQGAPPCADRALAVRWQQRLRQVEAVHGMLPKTKLGAAMYRKLKVYAGPDHPHTAQKPSKLEVA